MGIKIPNGGAWETVVSDSPYTTARLAVVGGWIVRCVSTAAEDIIAMAFVPDPNWSWSISTTDDD